MIPASSIKRVDPLFVGAAESLKGMLNDVRTKFALALNSAFAQILSSLRGIVVHTSTSKQTLSFSACFFLWLLIDTPNERRCRSVNFPSYIYVPSHTGGYVA